MSGGDVAKRLAKVPELEITVPNRHDRLILTAEVHHYALLVHEMELRTSHIDMPSRVAAFCFDI